MAHQQPDVLYGQLSRPRLAAMVGPRAPLTDREWNELGSRLETSLGRDFVLREPGAVMAYSYDATGERHLPRVVVVPTASDQIGAALTLAAAFRAPVLARGAGTNLSGGTMPLFGGMVLALQRLKEPVTIDPTVLCATVPVGMVNADFQRMLAEYNLFFAPDPSSHRISTIGGNVQENSGGPHCVKYGVTTAHVGALSGYLVDGTPLRLARPAVPGEVDLLGLVVGSEGTLMIGTSAELHLRVRPPGTATALIAYTTVAAACEAVSSLVAARLEPSSLELLDRASMEVVEPFVHAGYPTDADAVLLVEVEGTPDELPDRLEALLQATGNPDRLDLRTATTAEEAERLWLGRRASYGALARASAHIFVQDVTVPRPLLAAMMRDVVEIGAKSRLRIATVAHAGDGNLHPAIAYDPADPEEMERLHQADGEILARAAIRDGSITGEHGVGIDKLEHLPLMFSPAELAVMKGLKRVFDPDLRLNPGKAIWTGPDLDRAPNTLPTRTPPDDLKSGVAAVSRAIAEARKRGEQVSVAGAGFQGVSSFSGSVISARERFTSMALDADNLTARVGAGTLVGTLQQALSLAGLEWAVDPLGPEETVGGVVAAGLPAIRDAGPGPIRDQVLGIELVDGWGRYLRFGRPVLKNVAGYDVTKLLVGSQGRLGVIVSLDLRLRPRKPIFWRERPVPARALAERAWEALSRWERPVSVMGRPGVLLTGWERDPGDAAGDSVQDPRPQLLEEIGTSVRAGARFRRVTRGEAPGGEFLCWWPLSGVALGARDVDSPPRDPVVDRLQAGVRAVFDPDGIFAGGQPS